MSRNVRHRPNPHMGQKGAKKAAPTRKNSSSSDDDYAGVDLVSDSGDDEEPDVEKAETTAIMESGLSDNEQNSYIGHHFSLGDFDDQDFSGSLWDENEFFDAEMIQMSNPELETASEDDEPVAKSRTRARVRFQTPSADSSSSDTVPGGSDDGESHNAGDPSLFWDCDSLAPGFRKMLYDEPSSDASSCWDLEAELGGPQIGPLNDDDNSDGNSVDSSTGGLSGYESDSDEGETTDEEVLDESRVGPRTSVLQQDTSDSEQERPIARSKGPRYGSFVQEHNKPYAMLDKTGSHVQMHKPPMFGTRTHRSLSLGNTSQLYSPIFENSSINGQPDLMLGAVPHAPLHFSGNQAFGPPESFYPLPQSFNHDSSSYDEDDGEEGDEYVDYEAFFRFDELTSDEEDKPETGGEDGYQALSRTTPAIEDQDTQDRGNRDVLGHLNRGNINAFRKNQTQHQLISRNVASRDGLEFGGQGPIRGLKEGRLAAANTLVTPLRKQKNLKSFVGSSPGSPLANATAQKRKSSGELFHSHKRTRSTG